MSIKKYEPYMLTVLRILTGLLYGEHGTQKLFDFPHGDHGAVPLASFMGFAGALEVVGALLILFGLFTRPAAFILSGQMAVAYFMAHAPKGFFPANNGGDDAILFCFIFLFFVFAGAGPLSLDEMIWKKKAAV